MSAEVTTYKVREGQRRFWEKSWADEGLAPGWKGRGIAPEVVEAVEDGWLPGEGRVLPRFLMMNFR